jgi:hypothetical protein
MPSKPKTVSERLIGKIVRLVDGSDATVSSISVDDKTARLSGGTETFPRELTIAVEEIEARGGRFFQKQSTNIQQQGGAMSVETVETAEAVKVEDEAIVEETVSEECGYVLTCQACTHTYPVGSGGYEKPGDIANICPDCLDLATKGLLSSGSPYADIIPENQIEYLFNYYGLINTEVRVKLEASISMDDDCTNDAIAQLIRDGIVTGDPGCCGCSGGDKTDTAEGVEPTDFQSSLAEFLFARKEIALTLIKVINLISGDAELGEETEDAIVLKLQPFDFELSSLCGGYILTEEADGTIVRGEEFIALDELFSYFCGSMENDALVDEPEVEEPEVEDIYAIGTFHRLQNCKNAENNNKRVVIYEHLENGGFRALDESGTGYKVSASKLKSTKKSFDTEAAIAIYEAKKQN